MKIETLLVHGAVDGDEFTGSVNVPIYQTSTYKQQDTNIQEQETLLETH